jgi:hypothetical protein
MADEEALAIVVSIDEPAGDVVSRGAANLSGGRVVHIHTLDLGDELPVPLFDLFFDLLCIIAKEHFMPVLHWLDRDKHTKAAETVPYRLLEADDAHSAGDPETSNMLIQGDNLEALKALLPYYAGQMKCIFIDPPYNTRSAFEHYDDNLEHSQWLAMMFPRLQLLRDLLAEDGSIWVTIDDNEAHYLSFDAALPGPAAGRRGAAPATARAGRGAPPLRVSALGLDAGPRRSCA